MTRASTRPRGFTMIEMLMAVIIVGLVMTIGAQLFQTVIRAGRGAADAAANAGLPRFVSAMLAQMGTTASGEDVFRFLARYYRSRFSRTATALRAASVPIMVLGFGVLVALVALSIFTPLAAMIQRLSSHAGRWVL